jgi:hypothetical protein
VWVTTHCSRWGRRGGIPRYDVLLAGPLLNLVPRWRVGEISVAKNFNDYVAAIAANSPHILVMDWWRRLDLALMDYGDALKPMINSQNREAI